MGYVRRGTQPETQGFKRWFGHPEVVGQGGRPKVMYHGTDAEEEFTRFVITEDIGFHFGPPETANAAQTEASDHARIIPVYLSIAHPLGRRLTVTDAVEHDVRRTSRREDDGGRDPAASRVIRIAHNR